MKGVETSGEHIGRYRLLEKIGEGGMGVVHLAADPEGRRVAIKVLRPAVASDQTALRRLAREVDSMRRVRSPHVAEIVDADVTAESPYVVTQFVPGRTLEQTVRDDGPLERRALQRLATGLASALATIHAAGIVHRDLKPGNVMFRENGDPVVIDFGIAQGMDATRLTATGLVIGTPGFLAPEVIEGEDAGAAADVHSWAATVAFAATGRAPFGSGTFESIFYKIMEGRADLDGLPEPLLPIIRAAMARNPAERPTAQALVALTSRIDLDRTRVDPPRPDTKPLTAVLAAPPQPRPPASPRDFKGQLPPAPPPQRYPDPRYQPQQAYPQQQYGRPYPQQPQQYPRQAAAEAEEPKPYGLYRLLSLSLLAGAAGLALMTPSVAQMVVLIALLVLATADRAHEKLTSKRTRRGPRAGDVVGAVVRSPFSAIRVGLTMLLISPLWVMTGLVVLLVVLVARDHTPVARALAISTAVVVLVQCLGPGSEPARRQLARLWGAVLPQRRHAMIALSVVGLLAFFLVSFSLSQSPDLRPFDFPAFNRNVVALRDTIQRLVSG